MRKLILKNVHERLMDLTVVSIDYLKPALRSVCVVHAATNKSNIHKTCKHNIVQRGNCGTNIYCR